jgi:hypothetical protein
VSTPVIAVVILGSIAAVLAVFLVLGRLATRRRSVIEPARTADPASPWPQPSLQRIQEETIRRPPLSGPEV